MDMDTIVAEVLARLMREIAAGRLQLPVRPVDEPPPFVVEGDDDSSLASVRDSRTASKYPDIPITAPMYHPFEIIVEFSDDTSSATVSAFVRPGALYNIDNEGVRTFYTTDETSESTYNVLGTLHTVGTISGATSLYATLDISGESPIVAIATSPLASGEGKFSVLIGRISAGGGIEQYIHGHIPYVVSGRDQLDHSWLPTYTPGTDLEAPVKAATVSPGHVVFRDGTLSGLISPAAIDFTTNDKFWLVVDYTSTPTAGPNLTGGTAWPSFLDETDDKVNVPVFEFVGNEFSGLVRRQTNDIIDTRRELPDGNVPDTVRKSLERSTTADAGKDAFQMRGFDASGTTICKVPHVKTVGSVKDIDWRVPVTGPGTTPGTLDGYVITGITSGSSGDANASFTITKRKHDVANGDEVWGAEEGTGAPGSGGTDEPITISSNPISWSGGTLYQVWQVKSGGYGWDWVRAHG